jgi:hypothetical protein
VKVRCIKLINERTGAPAEESPWLTVGRTYHVLEVHIDRGDHVKFRLIGDDNHTPAYHNFDQFELLSNLVPTCWATRFQPGVFFAVGPRAWMEEGFWNRYFDGEEQAYELFQEIYRAILAEEP